MLSIQNLSKSFNGREILKDLNFSIRNGEIVVFFGPSGCGKSTLLNIISHLENSDSGNIEWKKGEKRNPKIGYVFQEDRLLP